MKAAKEYAWAIDVEICASPQEGLTKTDETDAFLLEALDKEQPASARRANNWDR